MANRQFFYFYAPTWDYPAEGPIKLGNVLSSVKKPHLPLFTAPPSDETGIFKTEKKSVEYTKEKLKSGRFSILTKFLSVFGFGVDVGAEVERSDEELFKFDTLETTQFIPTSTYLQGCIESEEIRRWLEKSRYRKPLYVITGLKVVTGAEANTAKSRTVGGNLSAEVDGSKQGVKWEGGNFVFAFRVSKVRVAKTGEVASEKEFNKGAMLENGIPQLKRSELELVSVEDPNPTDEGFHGEELIEDGEIVACAIPKEEKYE
ncbi:hypothetical protein ACHAQK_004607 [Fusarium lateritium]